MILVLVRILAIVKINSVVMKVMIRRFRRSPFLVEKIESWVLHSIIIWQNDLRFWMASFKMHKIFTNSITSIRYDTLLFRVPTVIRIETCFRIMASDTNNFRLWYVILPRFFFTRVYLAEWFVNFLSEFRRGEFSIILFMMEFIVCWPIGTFLYHNEFETGLWIILKYKGPLEWSWLGRLDK